VRRRRRIRRPASVRIAGVAKAVLKRHWAPGEAAFQRLLAWFDQGTDTQGERYLEIRDRLVHYFARRNCLRPDDLADETLNRVARRLEEAGAIDDVVPAQYCYIVAKFVLLESLRQRARETEVAWSDNGADVAGKLTAEEAIDARERTFACLERCLEACTPAERELIVEYYRTPSGKPSEQRKQLAARLGVTANSLTIRACRIRGRLETCVRACCEQ
jgi:DNA-directed RNA polymerase specialized sigma24 family protein